MTVNPGERRSKFRSSSCAGKVCFTFSLGFWQNKNATWRIGLELFESSEVNLLQSGQDVILYVPSFLSSLLSSKLFSMARNGEYKIQAFPDFSGALSELKQFQRSPQPEYQVCVSTGEGHLIIRERSTQALLIKSKSC